MVFLANRQRSDGRVRLRVQGLACVVHCTRSTGAADIADVVVSVLLNCRGRGGVMVLFEPWN